MLLTRRTSQSAGPRLWMSNALFDLPFSKLRLTTTWPSQTSWARARMPFRFGFEIVAARVTRRPGPSRENGMLKRSRGTSVPRRLRTAGTSGAQGSGSVGVPSSAKSACLQGRVGRGQPADRVAVAGVDVGVVLRKDLRRSRGSSRGSSRTRPDAAQAAPPCPVPPTTPACRSARERRRRASTCRGDGRTRAAA